MNLFKFFQPKLGKFDPATAPSPQERQALRQSVEACTFGPYMTLADANLNLLSVFDDLKYDRADADMLSPPMRRHAVEQLSALGFRQTAGTVLEHAASGIRCVLPKSHALGASPFDVTRYTPKGPQDYYLLTPTQTACVFIDSYDHAEAVGRVKDLITIQPINILRLADYLEKKPAHTSFKNAIGHLRLVQREAIAAEPLCRRRALR
ncbi:MAG: hypothetical protein AAF393_09845 [Pseudomonadota bacterium]